MMKILVTGAKGFVGKNLTENLKNIRDKKDRTRPGLSIGEIYEYDTGLDESVLERYCTDCDFVFHLAGVNRPEDPREFMDGNYGLTAKLLGYLKAHGNSCPVMLSSSIQASLTGRFADSAYGKSKLAAEKLLSAYASETESRVLIYRLQNLFGKWCRPAYNSVVATFCHAVANDLPYVVYDRDTELELLYIDDLVKELTDALESKEHRSGNSVYCYVPVTYQVTLGKICELLEQFHRQPETLMFAKLPDHSFEKKLYAVYISFLPEEKAIFDLPSVTDSRGSFTEFFKTRSFGQFGINISKPGMTKGQHWHNTKLEIFLVVSGQGMIRERKIGTDENGELYPVREYRVSGDRLQAVYMLPGYTHSLINLSDREDLVTVIWADERFRPQQPDTFSEDV